jgi:hypothetical protein
MKRALLAVLWCLVAACGSYEPPGSVGSTSSALATDSGGDSGADSAGASAEAATEGEAGATSARCCVVSAAADAGVVEAGADGGAEDGGGDGGEAGAAAGCSALDPVFEPVLSEPCWTDNPAGDYATWTCSSGECSDNGRSCDVGDTCTLQDVACQGVVQDCDYPWPR